MIYEKWQVSDEYRQRIKQAMRMVMAEFMQHRTVDEVAEKARVDSSVVQRLIDTGVAPYLPTRRIMKVLGVDATALPAECVVA